VEAVVLSRDLEMLRKMREAVEKIADGRPDGQHSGAIDNDNWMRAHASGIAANCLEGAGCRFGRPICPISQLPPEVLADQSRAQVDAGSLAGDAAAAVQAAARLREFADAITAPRRDADGIASALSAWQEAFVSELHRLMQMANPRPLNVEKIPTPSASIWPARSISRRANIFMHSTIEPRGTCGIGQHFGHLSKTWKPAWLPCPARRRSPASPRTSIHSTQSIQRAFYHADRVRPGLDLHFGADRLAEHRAHADRRERAGAGPADAGGLDGLMGASWNFANFFGLPILIGAGHEYGVFLIHRYREALHDPRASGVAGPADRALFLCAYVTCSSFGFFCSSAATSASRARPGMALGTLCIYLARIRSSARCSPGGWKLVAPASSRPRMGSKRSETSRALRAASESPSAYLSRRSPVARPSRPCKRRPTDKKLKIERFLTSTAFHTGETPVHWESVETNSAVTL